MEGDPVTIEDASKYAIAASWIVRHCVKNQWMQALAAIYYAWKTNRKWRHYARYCEPDKAAYLSIVQPEATAVTTESRT